MAHPQIRSMPGVAPHADLPGFLRDPGSNPYIESVRFITFRQDGEMLDGDRSVPVHAPRNPEQIRPEEVYAVCDNFFQHNQNLMQAIDLTDLPLPRSLGPPELDAIKAFDGDIVRILIVNGLGAGYGDLLVGSIALRALHTQIQSIGKEARIDLLIREGRSDRYCEVFKLDPHVRRIWPDAIPLPEYASHEFVVSTEHLLMDPGFHTQNFSDFFMRRFGLDPESHDHTLHLHADPNIIKQMERLAATVRVEHSGQRFLILNFFASAVRSIPRLAWIPIIEAFASDYRIGLVAGSRDVEILHEFVASLPATLRQGIANLAPVSSQSFDHLIGLVHHLADVVLTPDTSLLHVCGGLAKPCVALFPTIDPALRARDYPNVQACCPESFRHSPFWGESRLASEQNESLQSDPEFLQAWRGVEPAALVKLAEQAQRQADVATARAPTTSVAVRAHGPRVLVYAGGPCMAFTDRFHFHALSQLLPAHCELHWACADPFEIHSMAHFDLVLLGAGGLLDPKTLRQSRFLDLIHAAPRRVGLFGFHPSDAVTPDLSARVLDSLDCWFARTRDDVATHGQGRTEVHWLGEWLMTLIPTTTWQADDELKVDEAPFGTDSLDLFVRQVQVFRKVRARGLITLASALLAAESVAWEDRTAAEPALSSLLRDIFGEIPAAGTLWRVRRDAVIVYKAALQANVETLRHTIRDLLES